MTSKPFTLKPRLVDTHLLSNTAVLSMAELEQPCCEVCYRPGRRPFCTRCETSPAAERRRKAYRRLNVEGAA